LFFARVAEAVFIVGQQLDPFRLQRGGQLGADRAVENGVCGFSLGTMKGRSNTLNSGTRPVSGEAEVVTTSSEFS